MFSESLALAVGGARTLARVDELAKTVWQAFASGAIPEAEATRLAEMVETQRRIIRPRDTVAIRAPAVPRTWSIFGPKRPTPVSPDRAASMARRRRLAASGPMPPALAAGFTTGELAALRIVADEVRAKGVCGLFLGAIAARAGVSVTTARQAIRQAARAGLVTVEERRRPGDRNLANLVRIVSREWMTWIARGVSPKNGEKSGWTHSGPSPACPKSGATSGVSLNSARKGGGCGKSQPTGTGSFYSGKIEDDTTQKAFRESSVRPTSPSRRLSR